MRKQKCKNCKWWNEEKDAGGAGLGTGLCRVSAPRLVMVDSEPVVWPTTVETDWCSHFLFVRHRPNVEE